MFAWHNLFILTWFPGLFQVSFRLCLFPASSWQVRSRWPYPSTRLSKLSRTTVRVRFISPSFQLSLIIQSGGTNVKCHPVSTVTSLRLLKLRNIRVPCTAVPIGSSMFRMFGTTWFVRYLPCITKLLIQSPHQNFALNKTRLVALGRSRSRRLHENQDPQ